MVYQDLLRGRTRRCAIVPDVLTKCLPVISIHGTSDKLNCSHSEVKKSAAPRSSVSQQLQHAMQLRVSVVKVRRKSDVTPPFAVRPQRSDDARRDITQPLSSKFHLGQHLSNRRDRIHAVNAMIAVHFSCLFPSPFVKIRAIRISSHPRLPEISEVLPSLTFPARQRMLCRIRTRVIAKGS
jgi:hypothetical protein